MRATALICATAIAAFIGSAEARQQTAPEVAAALQSKYDTIRDFSADFTQQWESGVLKRKIT